MTCEEIKVEFAGLTHDHLMVNSKQDVAQNNGLNSLNNDTTQENKSTTSALSTIAILRRHPMYDSLVLVKRYRTCLNGFTLEFPTSETTTRQQPMREKECCKTKLVSVYLDGDDPIYQRQEKIGKSGLMSRDGEVVHVPMNGLLNRLDNYERLGIAIDSRVYAFAMGLKTAEKFLSTSCIKELQETPPL